MQMNYYVWNTKSHRMKLDTFSMKIIFLCIDINSNSVNDIWKVETVQTN